MKKYKTIICVNKKTKKELNKKNNLSKTKYNIQKKQRKIIRICIMLLQKLPKNYYKQKKNNGLREKCELNYIIFYSKSSLKKHLQKNIYRTFLNIRILIENIF